ncbi:hypothetical protein P7C70_g8016, partial [Phenoliferia sp. Uapishka_3]
AILARLCPDPHLATGNAEYDTVAYTQIRASDALEALIVPITPPLALPPTNAMPQSSPVVQHADPPLSLKELADLAPDYLNWDPDHPIISCVGGARQMILESQIYEHEQDLNRAFVQCCNACKLLSELIPSHPGYHNLPSGIKKRIKHDSEKTSSQLSGLKKSIIRRTEAWEKCASPVSRTSTSRQSPSQTSLLLKNTVQPASDSMSSTSSVKDQPPIAAAPTTSPKTSRTAKLKRVFGVGKGKGKGAETVGEDASFDPVASIEEEREDDTREWSMISNGRSSRPREESWEELSRQSLVEERHSAHTREFVPPVRRGTNSTSSSAGVSIKKLTLPGEVEHEALGIAYTPDRSYGPGSAWIENRPPSVASIHSYSSDRPPASPINYHSPSPSAPPWNPPVDIYAALHNSLQPKRPASPPAQPTWDNYPNQPPRSNAGAPVPSPVKLERSASRLTIAHQKQQGYSPRSTNAHYVQPLYEFAPPPSFAPPPDFNPAAYASRRVPHISTEPPLKKPTPSDINYQSTSPAAHQLPNPAAQPFSGSVTAATSASASGSSSRTSAASFSSPIATSTPSCPTSTATDASTSEPPASFSWSFKPPLRIDETCATEFFSNSDPSESDNSGKTREDVEYGGASSWIDEAFVVEDEE